MRTRRKKAIEKAQRELERHEDWKEFVHAVGGTIYKDEKGKLYGRLRFD